MTTRIPLRFETARARTLTGMRDFYLARDRFLAEQLRRRGTGTPVGTYVAPDRTPIEVWLQARDLATHTLVLGATGTGKSSLLERIARVHIEKRRGFALLDPHGDLFTRVAAWAIHGNARDLAIVNLARPEDLPSWNPLQPMPGVEVKRQVELVLGVIKRLYADEQAQSWAWGVKANEILMWTLRAMIESAVPATLVEIPSFLLLDDVRAAYLATASAETRLYFDERFGKREEMYVSAVVNKLEPFLGSMAVQRFLGAATSSLDLFGLVDRGGTLLVNTAKGYLGATSDVVGRLLMNFLQLAVLRRERMQPNERVPFSLVLDEAQSLAGAESGLEDLLVSARKYRVRIVLAAQELELFPKRFRTHVLANIGSAFLFRLPMSEAQMLARDIFEPQGTLFREPVRWYDPLDDPMLTPREEIVKRTEDLANLPRGVCYWYRKAKRFKARRITVHPPQKLPFSPGDLARAIAELARRRSSTNRS